MEGHKMSIKSKSKKEKSKISKLIEKSDTENDENEHELSYYINDRVKLMKEVLKIIKPKKIKSMAPDCIKDLDIEEINSMLLEELLGISNKRLKYIFNGQNPGEDSSSTDPEEEKQPIDIISLDDVSDDDFVIDLEADNSKKRNLKVKPQSKIKKIKKEKHDKSDKNKPKEQLQEENLMSVLELLELQARARAIRSQLMLEANKKTREETEVKVNHDCDTDDDDVIIEVPKNDEIVITSSDSENEQNKSNNKCENLENSQSSEQKDDTDHHKKKKIKLIRDRIDNSKSNGPSNPEEKGKTHVNLEENKTEDTPVKNQLDQNLEITESTEPDKNQLNQNVQKTMDENQPKEQEAECNNDDDEIILIVDQEEMDGIIGDT